MELFYIFENRKTRKLFTPSVRLRVREINRQKFVEFNRRVGGMETYVSHIAIWNTPIDTTLLTRLMDV